MKIKVVQTDVKRKYFKQQYKYINKSLKRKKMEDIKNHIFLIIQK